VGDDGRVRRERDEDFRRYVVARSASLIQRASSGPGDEQAVETRLLAVLARTYLTWDRPFDPGLLDDQVLASLRRVTVAHEPEGGTGLDGAHDGAESDAVTDETADGGQAAMAIAVPDRPRHDPRRFADRVLAEGHRLRRRRSKRAGGGIATVVLLLAVVPLAQSLQEAVARRHVPTAEQRQHPIATPGGARSTSPSAPSRRSLVDNLASEQQGALRAWVASLPRRLNPPAVSDVSSLLRVAHPGGSTDEKDAAAVVQARTSPGRWADIVRGDVSWPGRLDSSGRWLAFTVRRTDGVPPESRTTVYVLRADRGTVQARHPVAFGSALIGWFGDRLVIQRPDDAGSLVLIDRHGTGTEHLLGPRVIPREGGGAAAFSIRAGLSGCVTAGVLRLGPAEQIEHCPGDELLALSADGRTGVTRDLRWLDLPSGHADAIGRRPDGVVADRVEFVARDRVLISFDTGGRRFVVTCRLDGLCALVPPP
jgi:hypothetical protein